MVLPEQRARRSAGYRGLGSNVITVMLEIEVLKRRFGLRRFLILCWAPDPLTPPSAQRNMRGSAATLTAALLLIAVSAANANLLLPLEDSSPLRPAASQQDHIDGIPVLQGRLPMDRFSNAIHTVYDRRRKSR